MTILSASMDGQCWPSGKNASYPSFGVSRQAQPLTRLTPEGFFGRIRASARAPQRKRPTSRPTSYSTVNMTISVAIIGSGKSAREGHIPAYRRVPQARIVAIADPDLEKAVSVAKEFGIKGVYDDYAVMLKRRHPDLVSVCTAPSERKNAVLSALSQGAHILSDMPMGMTADEGKAILDAAREADRVVAFAAPRRFEPRIAAVREAIVNGDLGRVCLCRTWSRQSTIPADDFWQIKAEIGGGALSVHGHEMLDLALWLTGDEPVSVSGQLFHRFAESPDFPKSWFGSRRELDAEDLAIALVRCQESVLSLEADWLCSTDDFGIHVVGTKGQSCTSPFRMEVASKGEFADMTPTFFPETSAWYEQVQSFIDASLGHGKPFPRGEEALRVQRIADAIRQSSRDRREILLSDK